MTVIIKNTRCFIGVFIYIFSFLTMAGDLNEVYNLSFDWESLFADHPPLETSPQEGDASLTGRRLEQDGNSTSSVGSLSLFNVVNNNNVPTPMPAGKGEHMSQLGDLPWLPGTTNSYPSDLPGSGGSLYGYGYFVPVNTANYFPSAQIAASTSTTTTTSQESDSNELSDESGKRHDGLGYTYDTPDADHCFGWSRQGRLKIFRVVRHINALPHPMAEIKPQEEPYSRIKSAGILNPVRRVSFLLAVQSTQQKRNNVLAHIGNYYDAGSPEIKALEALQQLNNEYNEGNPFGLLFEELKEQIKSWRKDPVEIYLLPLIQNVKNKITKNAQTISSSNESPDLPEKPDRGEEEFHTRGRKRNMPSDKGRAKKRPRREKGNSEHSQISEPSPPQVQKVTPEEIALMDKCFGWKYTRSVVGIFTHIESLDHPLQTIDPDHELHGSFRNHNIGNPLKRMVLMLAVKLTQHERDEVIAWVQGFYDENSQESLDIKELKKFSDRFGPFNPFGLLFDQVKSTNIQPKTANQLERYFAPCMKELLERYAEHLDKNYQG